MVSYCYSWMSLHSPKMTLRLENALFLSELPSSTRFFKIILRKSCPIEIFWETAYSSALGYAHTHTRNSSIFLRLRWRPNLSDR